VKPGHDVTLFASGDSVTSAISREEFDQTETERVEPDNRP
jgi:hypothetical protein